MLDIMVSLIFYVTLTYDIDDCRNIWLIMGDYFGPIQFFYNATAYIILACLKADMNNPIDSIVFCYTWVALVMAIQLRCLSTQTEHKVLFFQSEKYIGF